MQNICGMSSERLSRIKELEIWAWKNLGDSKDKREWLRQVKAASITLFLVSEPTAQNYARIVVSRRFTSLPDQKKSDFMLVRGYDNVPPDLPAKLPKTLDEALMEERRAAAKAESIMISTRNPDMTSADHMIDKGIIEEE